MHAGASGDDGGPVSRPGAPVRYEPTQNIVVILYTQKEFVDITEAPSWVGALNDGKFRIPVGGREP
jgi:hypothetical protein